MVKKFLFVFSLMLIIFGSSISTFFNFNYKENVRENVTIKFEGEIYYKYHLPVKRGTTIERAIHLFGLLPTSDVEEIYIKISRKWVKIEKSYVILEDSTFKVGKYL